MLYKKIIEFNQANEDWISYVERMTFLNQTELRRKQKKGYFAIECWSTEVETTEKLISAKQISR